MKYEGGVISPLLANIYLNELDKWVEQELMPCHKRRSRIYATPHSYRESKKKRRLRDCQDVENDENNTFNDSEYRKLEYIRYADFILGFSANS